MIYRTIILESPMYRIGKFGRRSAFTLAVECLEDRVTPVSFASPVTYPQNGAATYGSIAYGDFTGNGKLDVAVGCTSGILVYLNDGAGNLTYDTTLGGTFCPSAIKVADINGDGNLDIIAADGGDNGSIETYLGNGNGTFQAPTTITLPESHGSPENALDITVADFNGDGKPDLAVETQYNGFVVYLNTGSGFGTPTSYPGPSSFYGGAIASGDFSGNGENDLAIVDYNTSQDQRLSIYMNPGNGTFSNTPTTSYLTGGVVRGGEAEQDSVIATDWQGNPLDFNGDGKVDLAVAQPSDGYIAIYLGNGDGTFQTEKTFNTGHSIVDRITAADFTDNGDLDLVAATDTSGSAGEPILLGDGTGNFSAPIQITSISAVAAIDVADLNGDGYPDLLSTDNGISVSLNTTDSVSSFTVSTVSSSTAGQGFNVTVTAENASDSTQTSYTGTIHFTSSDPLVTAGNGLPADYTFVSGDDGVHTFNNVILKTAGSDTITVTDTSFTSATGTATVTVSAGSAASIAVASGGGQSATVGTTFSNSLAAIVTDQYGNPVSGVNVTFAGPGSGAGVTFPSGTTATTLANGQASIPVTADTVSGTYSVTATATGISTPTSFSLTNVAGPAAVIAAVSGGGQSATVGAAFTNPLVAIIEDQYGNLVSGVTVTFAGPGSGASVTFPSGSTATTGANGEASVPITAGAVVGAYAATASVSGVSTPASYSLTNVTGPAKTITVASGGGQSATVGTAFTNSLVAVVEDQYGNPVSGVTMTFAGPGTGAGVTFPSGTTAITGANGEASVPITADTVSGTYSVTASVTGVSTPASFSLTNTAGPATSIAAVSGGGQSATVGAAFTNSLVASVEDQYGNPVSGVTVTFAGPGSGAGVTFPSGTTAITGTNGMASLAVKADTATGTYPVTASVTGISTPVSFSLTNTAGAATSIATVSGGGQSATVGTAFTNSLVVLVEDQYGNPVSGATVTFAGPGSGAGVTFPSGTTATTGANGQATLTTLDGNTTAGGYVVTASVAGVTTPASFTLTNSPGAVAGLTVTGFPTPDVAGVSHSIIVAAVDAYDNTVPTYTGTVHFTSSDPLAMAGSGLPADYTFVTGDDGTKTFSGLVLETAGTESITVTDTVVGSVSGKETGISVSPGAAASISEVSGTGQVATVGTAFTTSLEVVVKDQYGNPVSGVTVTFAGPGSEAGVTFPNGTTAITGTTGEVSVPVTANTVSGAYTVTASVSGVSTPASFSLTNTAGASKTITVVSGNGQAATVGAAFANSLVVVVSDQYGNPESDVTVTFAGPGSGAGVTFPSGATATTGANGQASLPVTADTVSGAYTVTASVTGVSTPASFSLTNNAGAATTIAVVSGSGQSTTVATAFTHSLVADVTDQYGNPVSGVTVTFAGPVSGAGVSFPSGTTATTGTNGQASVPITAGTTAGSFTVTASVTGISTPATFSLTNTVGAVKTITVASGGGQSATVGTTFTNSLVAVVKDQYGNPEANVTVTFAGPGSGAGVTFPDGTSTTTGTNGQASIPITADTVSGGYTVTASVSGVSTPATFSLTNTVGAVKTIAVVSGGGQSAAVGTAFANSLVAVVEDQYGNLESGATVTFAGPGSGAGVTFPDGDITTTGTNGLATVPVSANTVTGMDTVTASVIGLSTPASFSLTNIAGTATSIAAVSGGGQAAKAVTAFAHSLVVIVTDQYGNPVSGVTVTFAGPGSGAGVTFPSGTMATTAANGQASVPVSADTTFGGYSVTAAVTGVSSPATFTLTNTVGAATTIAVVSGDGQAATVGAAFTDPLVVIVTDQYGNPVSGVTVTFAGPGSGAGVKFPSGTTATTGINGQASLPVSADTTPGGYSVTATASGVSTSTPFALTNTVGAAATLTVVSGGSQSATAGAAFTNPLVAVVTDQYGNPVSGVTVTFAGPSSGAGVSFPSGTTATTAANGQASISVAANTTAGGYTVTATAVGVSAPVTFSLTNAPKVSTVSPVLLVGGAPNGSVVVYTPNGSGQYTATQTLFPFGNITADVRTAVGDVNGDGIPDYIFATGPGTELEVTVLSGAPGNAVLVAPFDPFLPAPPLAQSDVFTAGGFVSAGDFMNNGRDQIVVSPDQSGGPRVAIYDMDGAATATAQPYTPVGVNTAEVNPGSGLTRINNFLSVNANFRGGARTAVGDLNGDGVPDLAIAAGFGGGPAVLVINGTKVATTSGFTPSDDLIGDFFAFNSTLRDGAYLAIGDVLGNGQQDLILGPGAGGPSEVEVISGSQIVNDGAVAAITNPVAEFAPSDLGSDGAGTRVAVIPSGTGDQVNVAVGTGRDRAGLVQVYPGTGFSGAGEPSGSQLLNPFSGAVLTDGIFVG